MKTINRDHLFENRLTLVKRNRASYYLWHEKSEHPVIVKRTLGLDRAFETQDWNQFEKAEAHALGGDVG
jgi:hypothetical protein